MYIKSVFLTETGKFQEYHRQIMHSIKILLCHINPVTGTNMILVFIYFSGYMQKYYVQGYVFYTYEYMQKYLAEGYKIIRHYTLHVLLENNVN